MVIQFDQLPELSLYVHLPWCLRKCPYCDFNSHEFREDFPEDRYIDALIADLESSLPSVWGRPVISIFMGGGTPSLFSEAGISRLLSEIRARIRLLPGAEITLEANPGSFEAQRFEGFARAGVNRLSVGVQSFDDQQLGVLGRVHDSGQAREALRHAQSIFPRVNLDLMFGLSGQTLAGLDRELDAALEFGIRHLSCYQLTLEPNTRFAAKPPPNLPDDDTLAEMQARVVARLAAAGLQRYEISAYALPGEECRHNLNYWTFGDYLGIGAGAHGKISFADRIVRTERLRNPQAYMEAALGAATVAHAGAWKEELVGAEGLGFEFMLNALRLIEGVPTGRWAETTGMSVGEHPFLIERIGRAQAKGLLSRDPSRFQATARGLELLNDLQGLFLA